MWTWTAIDADSKLMISWVVGMRDVTAANELMRDLDSRLTDRIQLTTDGWLAYRDAVYNAFENDIDYACSQRFTGRIGRGTAATARQW